MCRKLCKIWLFGSGVLQAHCASPSSALASAPSGPRQTGRAASCGAGGTPRGGAQGPLAQEALQRCLRLLLLCDHWHLAREIATAREREREGVSCCRGWERMNNGLTLYRHSQKRIGSLLHVFYVTSVANDSPHTSRWTCHDIQFRTVLVLCIA